MKAERLRELLEYNPETGVFRWRVKTGTKSAGSIAGTLHKNGYCLRIQIDNHRYRSHRLAWLYVTGEWPTEEVDHKNCIGTDNRWNNLRLSDRFSNLQNQRKAHKNSSTGLLGVYKQGNKYRARITHNGKNTSLGLHDSAAAAHRAYVNAKRSLHQGNTL